MTQGTIRLADKILAGAQFVQTNLHRDSDREFHRDLCNKIAGIMKFAEVFVADEVAEYYFTCKMPDGWSPITSGAVLMPPFPAFFIEFKSCPGLGAKRTGVLFWETIIEDQCALELLMSNSSWKNEASGLYNVRSSSGFPIREIQSIGVIEWDAGIAPLLHECTLIGADGMLCVDLCPISQLGWGLTLESLSYMFRASTTCAFFALSFLNIKNVRATNRIPPQKLSNAFRKRHGIPMTKYWTLDIEHKGELIEGLGGGNRMSGTSQHVVRGHEVTYTAERPLFGRYTGTFFKPAHIRGSIDYGLVQKDYRLKATP